MNSEELEQKINDESNEIDLEPSPFDRNSRFYKSNPETLKNSTFFNSDKTDGNLKKFWKSALALNINSSPKLTACRKKTNNKSFNLPENEGKI